MNILFILSASLRVGSTVIQIKLARVQTSSETQGQSVGSGERARRKFSSTGKKAPGYHSHRIISKTLSGCRLLIGHKKCFVLLCPIGEQFLLSTLGNFCFNSGQLFSGPCMRRLVPNKDKFKMAT